MIQRISKNEDIIDVISGDVRKIKEVRYFTHSDPSKFIHPNEEFIIEDGEELLKCRICSEDLKTLSDGQLVCEVDIEEADEQFCNKKYNTIKVEGFNIWLQ